MKILTAEIKPFTLDSRKGYGVTAGRGKWHSSLFSTPSKAQAFIDALEKAPDPQKAIEVNVAYSQPFIWAKEK